MALGAHYLFMSVLRFVQFVLAITVCGLYGVDLHNASQQGKYQDSKWVRLYTAHMVAENEREFTWLRTATADLCAIGLRRSSRRLVSFHCRRVLDSIHHPNTIHLHLGYSDIVLLGSAVWHLWQCKCHSSPFPSLHYFPPYSARS